jgi:hypothetical protein
MRAWHVAGPSTLLPAGPEARERRGVRIAGGLDAARSLARLDRSGARVTR